MLPSLVRVGTLASRQKSSVVIPSRLSCVIAKKPANQKAAAGLLYHTVDFR